MGILIRGGRILDAATNTDMTGDVYVEDGVIRKIGEHIEMEELADRVIDAARMSRHAWHH